MLIYWRVIPYWKSRKSLQKTSQFEQRDEEFFHTDRECCCKFDTSGIIWLNKNWLVVLTILKNNSQWEGLSHILWKKLFETTSQRITKLKRSLHFGWFMMIPPWFSERVEKTAWRRLLDNLRTIDQVWPEWCSLNNTYSAWDLFFGQHIQGGGLICQLSGKIIQDGPPPVTV